jgi:hypothetical protein
MSLRSGITLRLGDGMIEGVVDEEPDVRFELISAGGDIPPLGPALFETLVQGQLGPQITEALSGLLTVDLAGITLEGDAFDPLNTDVNTIGIRPFFPTPPRVQNGWLVISMTAAVEIR